MRTLDAPQGSGEASENGDQEAIFKMQSLGYKPVLAHPERYIYLHENSELMTDLFDRGIFFQLNINSLIGYYSKPVQKIAQKMMNSSTDTNINDSDESKSDENKITLDVGGGIGIISSCIDNSNFKINLDVSIEDLKK